MRVPPPRCSPRALSLLAGPILLAALAGANGAADAGRPVHVDMRNVDFHVASDVTLHVRELRGRFVPVGRRVPYLDDKRSYAIEIDSGTVGVDIASLNALMARRLGGGGSNLDELEVSFTDDGKLRQRGVIDSFVDVPFDARAVVTATPDGRIRVRTTSIRTLGIPMTRVMKLLHLEMRDMVRIARGTGVTTDGNDFVLDPALLLPAPAVRGRVTAVRIERDQLVQTFGSGAGKAVAPRPLSRNHIYWRGGELSFGRLTMTDTDLELVDMDPEDPFDFSVDHWNRQLVAGYSKTLSNGALEAHMPDDNDLRRPGTRRR